MFRTARVVSVRERHGSEAAYKHIGVGFCVARFGKMGNAKASDRGTGDGTDSRAFSCPNPNPEQPFRGVERQVKTIRPMKKSAFSEQQPRCPPCPALEQPRCSKNKGAGPACCPSIRGLRGEKPGLASATSREKQTDNYQPPGPTHT